MTNAKPPSAPHRDLFLENSEEVNRLLEIHTALTGTGPGYKHNVEVLNKSAIVLLVATWESYVEELATNSFDYLLENCKDHKNIPSKILTASVKSLRENKNELEVWNLAGDGWRGILKQHKSDVIKKYIKSLNTPRTSNVNELFESILGVKDISKNWYWKGMSVKQANEKLEGLITLRGEIAHTVKTATSIKKTSIKEYDSFLCRLAIISHNRCTDHLEKICGKVPWRKYRFGHTV